MILLLTFQIGDERYATQVDRVLEVVPLVTLKALPLSDPWVAGVFDYRGRATPVIDLCQVFEQRPARPSLSTRVLVVAYPTGGEQTRALGLVAERVTETVRLPAEAFQDPGMELPEAPFLGGVYHHARGLLQMVDVSRLLPAAVADRLFKSPQTREPELVTEA